MFINFLVLLLRKGLYRGLEANGHSFEGTDVEQDLKPLHEIQIDDNGKQLAVLSHCLGTYGKVLQSLGLTIPPMLPEI